MKVKPVGILLVEDNPADARLVGEALRETGEFAYRMDHAETLAEALALLAKNKYGLVLLDLTLPDASGIDTYYKLREQFPDIPVVVLTEYTNEPDPFEALQRGIDIYLIKGRTNANSLKQNMEYALAKTKVK